jgi:hypothetical protein
VDYAFCMLAELLDEGHTDGASNLCEWMLEKIPKAWGIKASIEAYLRAHGVPKPFTVDRMSSLVKKLGMEPDLSAETKKIISRNGGLRDSNEVRMQVLRVPDATAGAQIHKFLKAFLEKFFAASGRKSFELLGDFKNLVTEALARA